MEKDKQDFIMRSLRRASYKWPARGNARKAAKVSYGKYLCADCQDIHQYKDTEMDHIEPVVPLAGFDGWDGVIERLFCDESGWQVLCKPCHRLKTNEENRERKCLRN